MYDQIEALVKASKLTFTCSHKTNSKHFLEHDRESFLGDVEYALDMYGNLSNNQIVLRGVYCFNCGSRVDYHLDGETLVPSVTTCFTETEIVVEIPVPTGVLVFTDHPEHGAKLIDHLDSFKTDINCTKGTIQRMQDYAAKGIAHFFVGNSSPHIYQKENLLLIGRDSYDKEDNEIPLDAGYVCTDLWWITAFDISTYEKIAINKFGVEKGTKMAKQAVNKADAVLNVEPGTYRLRYFIKISDERELYATMEKMN